jgi:hypothetical protein
LFTLLCANHVEEQTESSEAVTETESKETSSKSAVTPEPDLKVERNLLINLDDDLYTKKKYHKLTFLVNDHTDKENLSYENQENAPFLLVGSVQVKNLGDLETISDYRTFLCPINFKSSRLFWSTKEIGKKCMYTCRIRHIDSYRRELRNKSKLINTLIDQMRSSSETQLVDENADDSMRAETDKQIFPEQNQPVSDTENLANNEMDTSNVNIIENEQKPTTDIPLAPLSVLSQLDGQDDSVTSAQASPSPNVQFIQNQNQFQQQTIVNMNKNVIKLPTVGGLNMIQRSVIQTNVGFGGQMSVKPPVLIGNRPIVNTTVPQSMIINKTVIYSLFRSRLNFI